jgi:chemotaxis protein methyltransferase CheR
VSATVDRGDVERFRTLLGQQLGLHFEDDKLDALSDVVRDRMDALGCSRFGAYESRLRGPGLGDEVRALAGRLTVGETYFFRYWDHFRAFAEVVLPERVAALRDRRRLRILSAGCASGEEAYSLAMLVRDHLPEREAWELDIRGIDVNPSMIEKARRGRYTRWSLRETTAEAQARNFRADGGQFELDQAVRAMVTFEERNLVDDDAPFWQPGAFDAVFCRNVLMYFRPEAMRAVVQRIWGSLAPGGFLFLGHAETLRGVTNAFHLRHTHETFYYQRRDASEADAHESAAPTEWPRPAAAQQVAAALDLGDSSWVGAIQRASDRIAQLSRGPQTAPALAGSTSSRRADDPAALDLAPAQELLRQERFVDAMALLHALPSSAFNDPDAQLLRAALLTNSGQLREAESVCAQLLAADELNAGAHYLMALCREHAEDRAAAIEHDQAATYLDAAFAMPHFHLGLLAKRSGDLAQARAELGRALGLLVREDSSRILLFGGGFSREALVELCRSELRASGGAS